MTIIPGSVLCYVCGRGFADPDEMALHIASHPGRSADEYAAAQAVIDKRTPKPEPAVEPEPEPAVAPDLETVASATDSTIEERVDESAASADDRPDEQDAD